jgi:hypothetical protein
MQTIKNHNTMKQFLKMTLPVAAVVLLAACGGGKAPEKEAAKDDHAGHNHATEQAAPAGAVTLKDDKLQAVYQHYVHLTTALVNGDAAEAKIASNAIETGAKAVTGGEKIAADAAKIIAAADIDAQRTIYSSLSNEFITLVKKSGLSSGELYVDFCPMALNDKGGYWLSAAKDIKNPYFGESMLTCGEVKETIQ